MSKQILLDCTLRDGGYYNAWDFSPRLIQKYLAAMKAAKVDIVELGFRTTRNQHFNGPCAFTTDDFLSSLSIPHGLSVSVMVNGCDLLGDESLVDSLSRLFPNDSPNSPVDLVRIACHVHEFHKALPAVTWLKQRGYQVGFNLMQVADRSEEEVKSLIHLAAGFPIDVLYFADSIGSMSPEQTAQIIRWIRSAWSGPIGVHTHDNLGLALSNTLRSLVEGATWVDSTVTGMGRGPGNARTEELAIEIAERRGMAINIVPLLVLIREHFKPMQRQYGWGTNPYYYLAGKYGIHPTYIQEMLSDSRYTEEDLLAVIEHLRISGGKKFSLDTLKVARHFYQGEPRGRWSPREIFSGRDVLLLGTGPGVESHQEALERYIHEYKPLVLAVNTNCAINEDLIDLRVACHPVRLLADCDTHTRLLQPLITPYSMLPTNVRNSLKGKEVLDFGLSIKADSFEFAESYCVLPTSMVVAYALAVANSGQARKILMAGFDGYGAGDLRNLEMDHLLTDYGHLENSVPLLSVTQTIYNIPAVSIYGLV